jgi:exodeoxyribonuclease V alpha subunit
LKYNPARQEFFHNAEFPLEVEAKAVDILVVDESSMLDIYLFASLLEALPERAHLVLVGDKDQLPSVGPGTVLLDLIASRAIPVAVLSRLFRRDAASNINDIAFAINSGIAPELPIPDGSTKSDVYFLERPNPEEAAKLIETLCADQVPKKFGIPASDIAVLTPTNRGPLGTVALNACLQQRLNPDGEELQLGTTSLRIGDRVCQRVNNYQIDTFGVFNGDMGTVIDIDFATGALQVELWDGRVLQYDQKKITQLSLAYATSVHRAQGSEIPCVILALHESHFMLLERQLLYTAVTRAKKLLLIVGSKRALAIACSRQTSKRRYTRLCELLMG